MKVIMGRIKQLFIFKEYFYLFKQIKKIKGSIFNLKDQYSIIYPSHCWCYLCVIVWLFDPIAAVMSCFRSDPAVCGSVGLFGSKGPFMLVVLYHRGCGTWICPCWRSIHLPFYTSTNAYTSFFCYLVLCSYAGSLDSVRCVRVCFAFLLVRVISITTYSWN
jgi:hypothetical protein